MLIVCKGYPDFHWGEWENTEHLTMGNQVAMQNRASHISWILSHHKSYIQSRPAASLDALEMVH